MRGLPMSGDPSGGAAPRTGVPALVLAPAGHEAVLICAALHASAIDARACATIEAMVAVMAEGAGALLIAEEALEPEVVTVLLAALGRQEPWSDLPVVVLIGGEGASDHLSLDANLTVLERPLRSATLVRATRTALRARHRQYRVRDLLREREAERRSLADKARELAQSNAELEQFAFTAAHDLQEPARMIISYLQLMERQLRDRLEPKTSTYFAVVTSSAQRMQAMVRAVLDYSRIGKEGDAFADVDSAAALRQALDLVGDLIAAAGAVIETGDLPVVHGVEAQIARLFQNLISNAIKFRSVRPPRIRITAAREQGRWVFSVEDNGIGIPAEGGKRLFGIFQRLHPADEYPGTGIGLASCRKIVEQHGGRIWFESRPGVGSTFRFTLPAASAR